MLCTAGPAQGVDVDPQDNTGQLATAGWLRLDRMLHFGARDALAPLEELGASSGPSLRSPSLPVLGLKLWVAGLGFRVQGLVQ